MATELGLDLICAALRAQRGTKVNYVGRRPKSTRPPPNLHRTVKKATPCYRIGILQCAMPVDVSRCNDGMLRFARSSPSYCGTFCPPLPETLPDVFCYP